MKKRSVDFSRPAFLTLVAVAVILSSCATMGPIPVELGDGTVTYISPANQDGIQDSVEFSSSVLPLEKTVLKSYTILVTNEQGDAVRNITEEVKKGGFFSRWRNRREAVDPPNLVVWDGKDDGDTFVPDGTYLLWITVSDNKDNTGEAPVQTIVVDNTAPKAEVTVAFPLLTPNGDGRLDTVTLFQRQGSYERKWTGQITNAAGAVIRTADWHGLPEDFIWNGQDDGSRTVSAGIYSYSLSATDEAGNSSSFAVSGIEVEGDPLPIALTLSSDRFSPNGDGVQDRMTITPVSTVTEPAETWRLAIVDRAGRSRRAVTGTGVPEPFVFDGAGDNGRTLADGIYRAVLSVQYRGGQERETASSTFTADTRAPLAAVAVEYFLFSPDGDGRRDELPILQSTTELLTWTGVITDEPGSVVRRYQWDSEATSFSWDGRNDAGTVVPDGVYRYQLSATDSAGNPAGYEVSRIRVDSRPTPVRVTAAASRFSPNGDGIMDVLGFDLGLTVQDEIDGLSLKILRTDGTVMGDLTPELPVPASIQWDGALGGTRIADGSYVAEFAVSYEKGNTESSRSTAFLVDTAAPRVTVRTTPEIFSPDGDGRNDTLSISLNIVDASPIESWRVQVIDPADNVFQTFSGRGTPAGPITWNGRSPSGELVQSASDYRLAVTATDAVWNRGSAERTVPVDILVLGTPDRLQIVLSSIYFAPNTPDYRYTISPEQAAKNLDTLDRLAETLKRYPNYNIALEGHAVSVLWDKGQRAVTEHIEVLIPLSQARADAIRTALIERGIDGARMSARGFGGSRPVVPHGDLENRWKNRRVEFILTER